MKHTYTLTYKCKRDIVASRGVVSIYIELHPIPYWKWSVQVMTITAGASAIVFARN